MKSRIKKIVNNLYQVFGDRLVIDKKITDRYASDNGLETKNLVDAIIFPNSAKEISLIIKFCNQEKMYYSVRGGGSGKVGSYNLTKNGILICMEKMNRFEINEQDMYVHAEAGVINNDMQKMLIQKGLFFPVDPASLKICTIGGNLATNAGGPRSFKYGVMGDYALELTVVMPSGEILKLGSQTRKNVTGYSLKSLFIGSAGTLGIITSAVLKVIPYPQERAILFVGFETISDAVVAISDVYKSGVNPSAIEFIENRILVLLEEYLNESYTRPNTGAVLVIEVDGVSKQEVSNLLSTTKGVLEKGSYGISFAEEIEEEGEQAKIWNMRRQISNATSQKSFHKRSEDVVVPPSQIEPFISQLLNLEERYGVQLLSFGHLGDGNIHLNILNMVDESGFIWNKFQYELLDAIFRLVAKHNGTLSGEHGIGLSKKKYLSYFLSSTEIEMHQKIKKICDPRGLLNPGKIW